MTFEKWMKRSGLSQSSVDKYAGAIDGPLTAWGVMHDFISGPIREIHQLAKFEAIAVQRDSVKGGHPYPLGLGPGRD